MDRAPIPCETLFKWVLTTDSARILNGVLILEGFGWVGGDNARRGLWTMLIPLTPDFLGATDEAYGKLLGTLGKFFTGRKQGESFGACVGENIRLTTGGVLEGTTGAAVAAVTGMSGLALTFLEAVHSGLGVSLPLAGHVGIFVGVSARILSGGLISEGASALIAAGTGVAIPVAGGAGIGLFLGSVANCASEGVVP